MEFITTQKGKPTLIFDGSCFTLNRKMDTGVIHWRCAKRTCPTRITTQDELLQHARTWCLGFKRTYWSFLSSIPSMWMVPSPPVHPYFASLHNHWLCWWSAWYTDSSLPKVEQIITDSLPSWRKRCRRVARPCNLLLWWQTCTCINTSHGIAVPIN